MQVQVNFFLNYRNYEKEQHEKGEWKIYKRCLNNENCSLCELFKYIQLSSFSIQEGPFILH